MKTLLTTMALSFSAFMATTAFAGPSPDQRYDQRYDQRKVPPAHVISQHDSKFKPTTSAKYDSPHQQRVQNKQRPSSAQNFKFRVGQTLPQHYDSKRFEISARDARGLSKPNRNQQWYKINGDYVLVNEKNNRILRVI